GLVFQNYALFPHLTVFDNVAFGLRLRRLGKAEIADRVGRVLQIVDLPGMAARFPAQLSGGQQQRVAIARSLVLEPRILMFDEPLSNLDLKLRIQMREELRNLQRRLGKTSIYVTHDQTEALVLSDHIAVLSHGRIEQIGTPAEIYERPASAFVAEFIGSSNMLRGRIIERGEAGTIVETATGLRLHCSPEREGEIETAEVSILLRPERIHVGPPGGSAAPGQNCVSAQIADITYLGEDLHLSLDLAGGERLRASVKNSNAARGWAPRQSVELLVDAADLRLLSR
ncbi:MAG: ABC transporter ATP-binding protein, partial [Alphaproteobacteria bacterium]|nr:ABC transporter ATP-binding protein [Alphaproteobacteria bacterium]